MSCNWDGIISHLLCKVDAFDSQLAFTTAITKNGKPTPTHSKEWLTKYLMHLHREISAITCIAKSFSIQIKVHVKIRAAI